MSELIKMWVIHNREEDLDKIAAQIRLSDPDRKYVPQIHTSEEWCTADGTFHDVDGSNIVVLHGGILDHPNGLKFFLEKKRSVETWIIVSGFGRYNGEVLRGASGESCEFPECDFNWREFLIQHNQLKENISVLTAVLCGKVPPWRFEYFQEVTLRLLSQSEENKTVVNRIMGIEENGKAIEGEYEKRTLLNNSEKTSFRRAKTAVIALHERQKDLKKFCQDSDSENLYFLVHQSLYHLCGGQLES
jgi:hypothetical protein